MVITVAGYGGWAACFVMFAIICIHSVFIYDGFNITHMRGINIMILQNIKVAAHRDIPMVSIAPRQITSTNFHCAFAKTNSCVGESALNDANGSMTQYVAIYKSSPCLREHTTHFARGHRLNAH